MQWHYHKQVFALILGFALSVAGDAEAAETVHLKIHGMACEGCAQRIQRELQKTKGIISASIDYEKKKARIVYSPDVIRVSQIIEKIKSLGYGAEVSKEFVPDSASSDHQRRCASESM